MLVEQVLSLPDVQITSVYMELTETPGKAFGIHTYIPKLLPRLAQKYDESDRANLIALLTMNYLSCKIGNAIYVAADGIYVYLSGNITGGMARSDNVLNRILSELQSIGTTKVGEP